MNLLGESSKAFILGIVEGLTEFLPVSSTGHLILFGSTLEFEGPLSHTFEVFIQLGAILAVVVLYFRKFLGLLRINSTKPQERSFEGLSGIFKLLIACLPAFILGFLFYDVIKEHLFSPLTVALALILGGVIMILVERKERAPRVNSLEDLTYRQCLAVGLFQCFALWPGMSRSASTIVGGMLVGLGRALAAEFSFLVAVPVMFAAVGYDLWKSRNLFGQAELFVFAIGFIVSFVTAILAIRFFLALLERYTLAGFGYYRIVLGVIVLAVIGLS